MGRRRWMDWLVAVIGVALVVGGAVFLVIGLSSLGDLRHTLKTEQVTLGLTPEQIASGQVVDSMSEARHAADILAEDRRKIAPSYSALLGGARFDPTNPTQLSYAQGMNLQNSLLIAVLGFGLAEAAIGMGAALVLVGLALVLIALRNRDRFAADRS